MPVTWINLPLNLELSATLDELVYELNKLYLARPDGARRPTRLSTALALLAHALRPDGHGPRAMAELLARAPSPARPDLKRSTFTARRRQRRAA